MRKVTGSVLGSAVLLAAAGITVVPAAAAPTSNTTATFTVTAGTLDVAAPASAAIGSGAPGTVVNGALGAVTVTDGRASANATWATTVTATHFVTGAGTAPEETLASEIDYWSGPATATTGDGTFTPGQANAAAKTPLAGTNGPTAFSHTGGTGNNTATWNPTLSVRVPLDSVAGLYTGTVTHSVA